MSLIEEGPEEFSGDRDVVSAWIIVAMLVVGLVLVPAFNFALSDGVQAIARLH